MTNDLEKQFFSTFGIEPNCKFVKYCDDCTKCGCYHYPRITPEILLELICILNPYCYPSGKNIQHLKESVLEWCIKYKDDIKHQVRTLFEEG